MPSQEKFLASRNYFLCCFLAMTCFLLIVPALPVAAQTESVLYSFKGSTDGSSAVLGNLVLDKQGNLYGTTPFGGIANSKCTNGSCGTVFKVTSAGKEKVLYRFTGGTDGASPASGLVIDSLGNLYGTTFSGGIGTCPSTGCGTVFKVTPSGAETVLYSFTGGADGALPQGGLVMDKLGNLYGTTETGVAFTFGTIFKLTPSGVETVLHYFAGGMGDGADPSYGNLLMDPKGNLYGTTEAGGTSSSGTVFEVTSAGVERVIHNFAGGTKDGSLPEGSMARDKQGNLYGTTSLGGSGGCGIVFKLIAGKEKVLHAFTGGVDGCEPLSGIVLDTLGNLYGTTEFGGSTSCSPYTCGILFEVSASGTETILHSFEFNGKDGVLPFSGLVIDKSGNFYGATADGGTGTACGIAGCGTVYRLTP